MNGTQLKRELAFKGVSQRATAKAIGISERQMRRYCADEIAVPMPVQLAVRLVVDHMSDAEFKARVAGKPDTRLEGRAVDGRKARYK